MMTLVVDYDFIIVFRHLLSRNGDFFLSWKSGEDSRKVSLWFIQASTSNPLSIPLGNRCRMEAGFSAVVLLTQVLLKS